MEMNGKTHGKLEIHRISIKYVSMCVFRIADDAGKRVRQSGCLVYIDDYPLVLLFLFRLLVRLQCERTTAPISWRIFGAQPNARRYLSVFFSYSSRFVLFCFSSSVWHVLQYSVCVCVLLALWLNLPSKTTSITLAQERYIYLMLNVRHSACTPNKYNKHGTENGNTLIRWKEQQTRAKDDIKRTNERVSEKKGNVF